MRKLIIAAALVAPFSVLATPAHATTCVPSPAVPAVAEVSHVVIDTPAVEAVAEVWANFSPNKDQGPFVGPPSWPLDVRGTWQIHDKIPGGHVGADGVYQKGEGNGDWFYRQAAVAAVAEVSHVVIDVEAKAAVDAVVCPEPTTKPTKKPVKKPTGPEGLGGGEQIALPHTGLSDREMIYGAMGIALITAGGVALYTARRP